MEAKTLPYIISQKQSVLTTGFLSLISFTIPFLLGHPQILVGAIVNAGLFLAALFLPKKQLVSLVFLPSLGVLSRGLIFGPLTPFLILVLPFIWFSNWFLTQVFKKAYSFKLGFILSVLLAAGLKTLFLFSSTWTLVNLKVLPKPFLISMGQIQFITACLGGVIAWLVKKVSKI